MQLAGVDSRAWVKVGEGGHGTRGDTQGGRSVLDVSIGQLTLYALTELAELCFILYSIQLNPFSYVERVVERSSDDRLRFQARILQYVTLSMYITH